MLDGLQKIYMQTFAKPYVLWYLKKERIDTVRGFELTIRPTVFHPKFFFSSTYLFDFVSTLNLSAKRFLEIGCGSGLISLLAYQKKALVVAIDINAVAVECTELNFAKNFRNPDRHFSVLESDLFDSVPPAQFDVIVINPPYFFDDIKSDDQLAWNCGKNGEYFVKLFFNLGNFIHGKSDIYMILADNCEIGKIKAIAEDHQFRFTLIVHKKIKWETNFIFKITSI
jgi:release factor glutamine methyltransferase